MAIAFSEDARVAAQLFSHRDWSPAVERERKLRPHEIVRRDTDHLIRAIVELDRLADDVWITSHASLPEAVAQHDDVIRTNCFVFVWQKRSAKDWFHLKHIEVIR